MDNWNSAQYLKFERERTQPAIDLANRLTMTSPRNILDIGCGPGNSTEVLAKRFPHADILGVDNSTDMIERAKKSYPALEFDFFDANDSLNALGRKFDIVFSNACLQWVPDHPRVLTDMMNILNPGGMLAVQMPINYEAPVHRIIREVIALSEWKAEFTNPRIFHTLRQDEYFDLLSDLSKDFSLWEIIYFHELQSHTALLEWYRGTGLRPYLNVLSETKKVLFEQEILRRIELEFPVQKNGSVIFRFPRLFFTAVK